jgi:hypothetical protein
MAVPKKRTGLGPPPSLTGQLEMQQNARIPMQLTALCQEIWNPKRAGKKIWEVDFFQDYGHIQSGNYREW